MQEQITGNNELSFALSHTIESREMILTDLLGLGFHSEYTTQSLFTRVKVDIRILTMLINPPITLLYFRTKKMSRLTDRNEKAIRLADVLVSILEVESLYGCYERLFHIHNTLLQVLCAQGEDPIPAERLYNSNPATVVREYLDGDQSEPFYQSF